MRMQIDLGDVAPETSFQFVAMLQFVGQIAIKVAQESGDPLAFCRGLRENGEIAFAGMEIMTEDDEAAEAARNEIRARFAVMVKELEIALVAK